MFRLSMGLGGSLALRGLMVLSVWGGGLLSAGCGSGDHRPSGPGPVPVASSGVGGQDFDIPYVPDTRPVPPNDLGWQRCPLVTGSDDSAAECATADVPLDWNQSGGQSIQVFVKRYRSVSFPRGQLWLLGGTPGASGADFDDYVLDPTGTSAGPTFASMAPDLEVYLVDQRGTGRSTRLGCDVEEAPDSPGGATITPSEWPDCQASLLARWGADGLAGFSTSQAARDLGELVGRTRHGDEPVFVYAVSYGTSWAQRYLAGFPDQPNGVVLDSVWAPGKVRFGLGYDQGFEQIGQELLNLCPANPSCSTALGSDPWKAVDRAYQQLDNGRCSVPGFDRVAARQTLGVLLTSWVLRDYIPAVLSRLERCNADDVTALGNLYQLVSSAGGSDGLYSPVLNMHLVLSEYMEDPVPTLAQAEANVAPLHLSLDVGPAYARVYAQGWPVYPRDATEAQFAAIPGPLLMLSGQLDPETPPSLSEPMRAEYTAPNQSFVSVPYAARSVLDQSPLAADQSGSGSTCGERLIRQFLADPSAPLDQGCLEQLRAPDFTGTEAGAQLLFGQATVWGLSRATPEARALERPWRFVP